MTRLREIMQETGMPQDNFLVVPNDGVNLVWLDGTRGAVSFDHDRKLSVHAVKSDQVGKIAEQYVRQHTSGGVGIAIVEDLRKQIWSRMFSSRPAAGAPPGDQRQVPGVELAQGFGGREDLQTRCRGDQAAVGGRFLPLSPAPGGERRHGAGHDLYAR